MGQFLLSYCHHRRLQAKIPAIIASSRVKKLQTQYYPIGLERWFGKIISGKRNKIRAGFIVYKLINPGLRQYL
ncbi:hypothetical protein A0257_07010 [Hymenobacter psoromatis]|nr:hypothetical protein A0257_07010 [Hymenobacter psoromatis]